MIKKLAILIGFLFVITLGSVFSNQVLAACQCPNTERGYNGCPSSGGICWGMVYVEPSGTCAICPGASCTGCSPVSGGGGGQHNPPPAPPPKPQPFTVNDPSTDCSGINPFIDVTWTVSTNANYYKVYRSDSGFISGQLTNRSYHDTNVVSGHSYFYYVYAYTNAGDSVQASAPAAIPAKVCDTTPPSVHINWTNPSTCYTPRYWVSDLVQPITIHVDDVHNGTSTVPSSGILSVYMRLHSVEAQSDSQTYSATITSANSDGSFEYTLPNPFKPDYLVSTPPPRNYLLTAYATDNAGNEGNSQNIQFKYDDVCTPPHIQTQNGDVHSQTSVGR